MLRTSTITTVLPVNDLEASKKFYTEKLGLNEKGEMPSGETIIECGNGSSILLRPMQDARPTGLTEMSFNVSNIEKEVEELENKGVKFEDYNEEAYRTNEKHINTNKDMKAAWFKDPSGNVLCLHQYRA